VLRFIKEQTIKKNEKLEHINFDERLPHYLSADAHPTGMLLWRGGAS
jgi:hypothetical protein